MKIFALIDAHYLSTASVTIGQAQFRIDMQSYLIHVGKNDRA